MSLREIFSPTSGQLLHLVFRTEVAGKNETAVTRIELVPPENWLQAAQISANSGESFKAHRHLERSRSFSNLRAQESWVVLQGKVRVTFYDEDDTYLETVDLSEGDCSITLAGGHGYEILESARVMEFKSGPYEGQSIDKTFIAPTNY